MRERLCSCSCMEPHDARGSDASRADTVHGNIQSNVIPTSDTSNEKSTHKHAQCLSPRTFTLKCGSIFQLPGEGRRAPVPSWPPWCRQCAPQLLHSRASRRPTTRPRGGRSRRSSRQRSASDVDATSEAVALVLAAHKRGTHQASAWSNISME